MITQMDDKFLKCEDSCFAKTGNSDCAKTDCAAKTGCKSLDSKGFAKIFMEMTSLDIKPHLITRMVRSAKQETVAEWCNLQIMRPW